MLTPAGSQAWTGREPIVVRLSWTVKGGVAIRFTSHLDDREVPHGAIDGAGEDVIEQEAGRRVSLDQRVGLVPAGMDGGRGRPCRLRDGDVGAAYQLVERGSRGRIAGVGEDASAQVEAVAATVHAAVVQRDRLVLDPGDLAAGARLLVP